MSETPERRDPPMHERRDDELCPPRHELEEPLGHFVREKEREALTKPDEHLTTRERREQTHPPRPKG